jgi:hypothetical protein
MTDGMAQVAQLNLLLPVSAGRSLLLPARRQSLAAGVSRIEIAFEACRRSGAFNHDQIVVLPLEAGCGKVRGAGAQQLAVDLIALEMHRRVGLVLLSRHPAFRRGH